MSSRIDEMRSQIRETSMPGPAVHSPRGRRGRVGVLSGGVLALAATVAAIILLSVNSSTPPAYAATVQVRHGVRTVTITLREEQDIPQLNARLAAEHTRIRVVPVLRGCDAPVHAVSNGKVIPGPAKTLLASQQYFNGRPQHVISETIQVDTIAGRTFVIPDSGNGLYSGGDSVVIGSAPACFGIGPRFNITG